MRKRSWARADTVAHEGWSVDAIGKSRAPSIQAPDQWHPIRKKKIKPARNLAEMRIVPAHRDHLGVGQIHRPSSAFGDEVVAIARKSLIACLP